MEAIGTLAGGIAHDFNNILAWIIGFSELVEEDLPEESMLRGYMKNVLKASFRGRDLVKQILTFSRKTEHSRHTLSVNPIIKETVKLLRSSLPSTLELVLDPSALNDHVHASAVELQQIVMNLVTNAARAIGEKGGDHLYLSFGCAY
jgi:signal transduction histidine kinase